MLDIDLKALFKRLNAYCTRSMEEAAGLCVNRGNYEVSIEHLLLILIEDQNRDVQLILRHYGISQARVEKSLQHAVEIDKTGHTGSPVFAPLLIELLQEAWMRASVEMQLTEIRSGVLIAALVSNPSRYGQTHYFDTLINIRAENLRRHLSNITAGSKEETAVKEVEKPPTGIAAREDTALGKYTIDFTGQARAGEVDPVFCRDREIRQIIDILNRRRKNNPIAVGDAGVGKTAVIEGLALKIVEGDVPDVLKNAEIYGLDLGLLQAGASVKGEFENRLKSVIEEVKSSPKPIILFIDEAHTLIGAGGQAGAGDAANLLKPALARGELRTIAATTWSEYQKYFEKDAALARRFQLVKLDEPSPKEAVTILRGLRDKYEQAHGVYVRDAAVEAAANFSARYISGRQLPDKAVDVLDTAAARVKISVSAKPDRLLDLERQIQTLERESSAVCRDLAANVRKEYAIEFDCRGENNERITELTHKIRELNQEREALTQRWEKERDAVTTVLDLRQRLAKTRVEECLKSDCATLQTAFNTAMTTLAEIQGNDPLIHFEVTLEVVSQVIADWTGIPVGKMVKNEVQSILSFKDSLKQRIKGQDNAIEAIDQSIRVAKVGLRNPNTPMGAFLLVGPSGVGKSETALGVAELLFGGERFMVTINMSEFQEKHTVSRLIGSPPGYVGYGEGGILTEAVRQRPYSVVLLDEVEKADLEVMNLFYQAFDKGMLSDGEGRTIDFKNTVFFLTSNLAASLITQLYIAEERPSLERLIEVIRPTLSQHFKPALLARMEIVPYLPINRDAMGEIVKTKLGHLAQRLQDSQKIRFTYQDAVAEQIVQRCTEVETGARNIDHIVNHTLLPRIASEVLAQMSQATLPETLEVGIDDAGNFTFQFSS
ncbi:MAG: type VI secretion system ATPase TssH [Candidatus Parabeggiatoa sp. nov. 1]|nr:MAG: type VI secretion system ATPase TssH [Gammaproteobacteria bacterium]